MYRGLFIIVTVCCLQAANSADTKGKSSSSFNYPGPVQDTSNRYGTDDDNVPDQCKGKTYCTIKPADYPQAQFNALFKGTAIRRSRELKSEDIIPSCDRRPTPSETVQDGQNQKVADQPTLFIEAYGDRQGDPDLMDNCNSQVTFEPLYKIRSTRGEWHTVVQAPEENYIQRVRLETCNEEGSSCFTGVHLGAKVTTYCKQKTSIWQVVVSDGKNGTEKIKAELPICCSCHYKINN